MSNIRKLILRFGYTLYLLHSKERQIRNEETEIQIIE